MEYDYDQFVHAGANLSDADKTELKKLNEELATLSNTFSTKLLAATKDGAYVTTDKAALAGLSDAQISAAAEAAKGRKVEGYRPSSAEHHAAARSGVADAIGQRRQALFTNSWNRAERGDANDTRDTIAKIAQLRAQKGKLLGFPNFAAWKIEDQMAKTPEAALKFMDALVPAATARAASEAQDIQAVIDGQKGGFKLQPWDWDFYAEQVRKAKYDLDEEQVKPYFELNNVLQNGVFYAANQLYGLTFKERKDLPVYDPGMRVFEVFNADGSSLALFYCDYFKRDNKHGGAWMNNFVDQSKLLGTKPVVVNVANFAMPAAGRARAAHLGRREDDVPRIRSRAARHVCQHPVPQPFRHLDGARLRGVSVAVQRALGDLPDGLPALRQALQDRRAHAGGTGGEDQEVGHLQQGLRHHRVAGCGRTGHEVAHASGQRSAAEAGCVRDRSAATNPPLDQLRAAALPFQLLQPHLGQRICGRLLRLPLDPDAGRRCLSMVRRPRRPDARQRRPLPRNGVLARQYRGPGDSCTRHGAGRSPASNPC